MDDAKVKALEAAGFRVGDAGDFLGPAMDGGVAKQRLVVIRIADFGPELVKDALGLPRSRFVAFESLDRNTVGWGGTAWEAIGELARIKGR